MTTLRLAAVAGHFGRDLERGLTKVLGIVDDARARGVDLLVLPHAALGGYLTELRRPDPDDLPPALAPDDPRLQEVAERAGTMTVCLGYTEAGPPSAAPGPPSSADGPPSAADGPTAPAAPRRWNAAVCVSGGRVLGRHRKVHQPAGEALAYAAGEGFSAFDTPVGRIGMLIDYDKTFPEAARALALDGAELLVCLSAWPASITDRAARLPQDRQSRLFDLYDAARAAENQVVLVSSNQTGVLGALRFLGQAKVVGPGGDVLARTLTKGGMACADLDVAGEVARARRVLHHLDELRAHRRVPS